MPHLRIQGSAQQADIPEAGCVFLQLGENRWAGPGNPGRWADSKDSKDTKCIKLIKFPALQLRISINHKSRNNPTMKIEEYKALVKKDIQDVFRTLGCQPVVFAGSGLSKRYIDAPNWNGLLEVLIKNCPGITKELAYFQQVYKLPEEIGSELAKSYHEWAWGDGRKNFPDNLFDASMDKECFIKFYVSKIITSLTPVDLSKLDTKLKSEIEALKGVQPHCIITTNYDKVIDLIFDEYAAIVGQKIIKSNNAKIGEIFKIHGCVSDPNEMVLTASDYEIFIKKKKYLSAKLLTYFLEHPVIIVGYSATDRNIRLILQDIDEILSAEGGLVPNIYMVMRDKSQDDEVSFQKEILLDLGNSRSMRVKVIYAREFEWVYKSFNNPDGFVNLNPKILRSLMAKTYDLVRNDIPRMNVQVDYAALEGVVASGQSLGKILGISAFGDATMFNAAYPYSLTQVAQKLGYSHWVSADSLLSKIKGKDGIDLKASDNNYHVGIKSGMTSIIHKYSEAAVQLLCFANEGKPYKIELKVINKK